MRRSILWIILVVGLLVTLAFAGIAAASGLVSLTRGQVKSVQKTALYEKVFTDHAALADLPLVLSEGGDDLHYPDRCLSCHEFSDSCDSCHWKDAPIGRHRAFGVDCSYCHQPPETSKGTVDGWHPGVADHNLNAFGDCQSCHEIDRPQGHFQSNCSSCHRSPIALDDTGWNGGRFDHDIEGAQDCLACHEAIKPANHFAGQCSACHIAGTVWSEGRFNHQNAGDCQRCHTPPQNHFGGQCSACHQVGAGWERVSFNHRGAGNCQACHNPPRKHFGGECKQCHNPDVSWGRADLRWHRFSLNHGGANGNCSTCHTNNGMNCTSCHEHEGDDDDHDDDDHGDHDD